jgi:hypothetical protein
MPPGVGDGSRNTLTVSVGGIPAAQGLPYSFNRPVVYAIRCVAEVVKRPAVSDDRSSIKAADSPRPDVVTSRSAPGASPRPQPPSTSRVVPQSVSHELVTVCYISGAGFGADESLVSVQVRGVKCRGLELLLPHSKLRVLLPASLTDESASNATAFTANDFLVSVAGVLSGSTNAY